MGLDFAHSKSSTLGVEWELALVDPKTGKLLQNADEIIQEVNSQSKEDETDLQNELMLNTVEIATQVCSTVSDAMKDLAQTVTRIQKVAHEKNTRIVGIGLHPEARAEEQNFTELDRYTNILKEVQVWAKHLSIWGIHTHVGINDKDKVIPIMNGLLSYAPQFQALSASSPFWMGEDSGYASNRSMLFQQFPTAGLPPRFDGWEDYAQCIAGMIRGGIIEATNDVRWDIRPAPNFGTIELRICDGLADLREIAAVTALAQCLVDEMSEHLDNRYRPFHLPQWFLRENKWRTSRYGMDATIFVDGRGNMRPIRHELLNTVERLMPRAKKLQCAKELEYINTMVEKGVNYERQRYMHRNGKSYGQIVLELADELDRGIKYYTKS